MSVDPSLRGCRAVVLAAATAALVVPSAAFADKPEGKGAKRACEGMTFSPPGLAGRDKLPPGIAKKQARGGAPCDKPAGPDHGEEGTPVTVPETVAEPTPDPEPVTTTVASTGAPAPCVKGRWFKVKLTRWGAVRRARVLLNGKPITVKIARKGRKAYAVVDLRHRKAGTYVVRQSIVTRRGKLRTGTRRYQVCG